MARALNSLRRAQPHLGTLIEIEVEADEHAVSEVAMAEAFAAVRKVHDLMSFHDARSDVSRINQAERGACVPVAPWTYEVLEAALDLETASDGTFNVATAPILVRLGYLPRSPFDDAADAPSLRAAIELLGDGTVIVRQRCCIDLGGIAKGYAVDRALAAARQYGAAAVIVNAGGDIAAYGNTNQLVSIRHPRDPSITLARATLSNGALASSAPHFSLVTGEISERVSIIDPAKGEPTFDIVGVSVRAPTCMAADALTKVVSLRGLDAAGLLRRYESHALVVTRHNEIYMTSGADHIFCP